MRLGMLFLMTFIGLAVVMWPNWQASMLITGLGTLAAALWYTISHFRSPALRVDEEALVRDDPKDPTRIRWVDIKDVTIGETLIPQKGGFAPLRFAVVRGLGSRQIAFADLTLLDHQPLFYGTPAPVPVSDVAHADVLLALVCDQLDESKILDTVAGPELEGDGDDGADVEKEGDGSEEPPRRRGRLGLGLFALAFKLGSKAATPILGFFKGTQGALALLSAGALALLFTWQAALAFMVFLFIHELGHVFAMRRHGIAVRGIYFIPIVGAATVPVEMYRSRWQQAHISLGGPIWSTALALIPPIVLLVIGGSAPLLGAIGAAFALFNILNLLPIQPLDGGKLLSAVGSSISSRVGLIASVVTLLTALILSTIFGYYLVTLLIAIGFMEVATERAAALRVERLSFAQKPARFTADVMAKLRLLTRPGFPPQTEEKLRQIEKSRLEMLMERARITPMSRRQAGVWLSVYGALVALSVGTLLIIRMVHPDLGALFRVLT